MKSRKFWKRVLTLRGLLCFLIVIALSIFSICYFGIKIDANTLAVDNMDFSTEGFENFAGKSDASLNKEYVVSENDELKMFFDETTTIVTVVRKSSLKDGFDPNLSSSYTIAYSSAKKSGNASEKANLVLKYAGSDITKTIRNEINSFANSVSYQNTLTGESGEKHYSVKYLTKENDGYDAVQVYYSIGNFSSRDAYFPAKMYTTLYEPSRCVYKTEAQWLKAMEKYQEYLDTVGDLNNTYEERFRGNTKSPIYYTSNPSDPTQGHIYYGTSINIYGQKNRDYLIDVVLPEMEKEGFDITYYDKEELDESYRLDTAKNPYWTLSVPSELMDYNGPYFKKFFNNEDSPLTSNPFMAEVHYQTYFSGNTYYQEIIADGSSVMYGYRQLASSSEKFYRILYSGEQSYNTITYSGNESILLSNVVDPETGLTIGKNEDPDEEYHQITPFISAGFPARDSDGKFIYDEEGNVKRELYTQERVISDNNIFQAETEGLPAFKIALEFRLDDNGMVVSIPNKSIVDASTVDKLIGKDNEEYKTYNVPYYVVSVSACNNMTTCDNSNSGYILVPDGSGAIIKFNSAAENIERTGTVSAPYYGKDLAFINGVDSEKQANLMLGMFAFVNQTPGKESGILGVIEKGGGQVSLTAGASASSKQNYATLTYTLRASEAVKTGTVNDSKTFDKYNKKLCKIDTVTRYILLDKDELDYSTIAKIYQDYLVQRDGLTRKDNTNKTLNDITFMGAFDKYALTLGIKHMEDDSLTTFKEAKSILEDLRNNNLNTFSVSYKSWTSENLEYEVGNRLKVSNILGKKNGMRLLYNYCKENNIEFYPEMFISTTAGYDYLLGSNKYTTRSVANEEAIMYQYNQATTRQDKKLSKIYHIAPQYYKSIAKKVIKDFDKLNIWNETSEDFIGGFYLSDLGNQYITNYRRGKDIYPGETIAYQEQVLDMFKEKGKIKLNAPYDYAFKYVDTAIQVPVSSSMYTIYDESIPFYQLVVSGLFDYTTEQINGSTSRSSEWFFIKALESGSNFSYLISYEDSSILLKTDYTQYFQTYYNNWKDSIIRFASLFDYIGIHERLLLSHEYLENGLVKVIYQSKTTPTNTIELIINNTENSKTYLTNNIPAYSCYYNGKIINSKTEMSDLN